MCFSKVGGGGKQPRACLRASPCTRADLAASPNQPSSLSQPFQASCPGGDAGSCCLHLRTSRNSDSDCFPRSCGIIFCPPVQLVGTMLWWMGGRFAAEGATLQDPQSCLKMLPTAPTLSKARARLPSAGNVRCPCPDYHRRRYDDHD